MDLLDVFYKNQLLGSFFKTLLKEFIIKSSRVAVHFFYISLATSLLQSLAFAEDIQFTKPVLRIETGIHTDSIYRIGANKNCTMMVTGSSDKTVRLWALPGHPDYLGNKYAANNKLAFLPELIKTIRPPIKVENPSDNQGKVYAVALSPDGELIAAGGWFESEKKDKWALYIYTKTGDISFHADNLPERIVHLTFSNDGRFLAATLREGQGVIIWNTHDWTIAGQDNDYGAISYGATFDSRDGSLYTLSFDGYLRKYGPNYKFDNMVKYLLTTGKKPYHIAVNPHDNRIAVSYVDTIAIDVFSIQDFSKLDSPSIIGIKDNVGKVAWSADGKKLYAGGSFKLGDKYTIRAWDSLDFTSYIDIPASDLPVSHIIPCADDIAFSARDPIFGLISAEGKLHVIHSSVKPDMREKRHGHLTVSDDGLRVRFGLEERSNNAVLFDLNMERLTSSNDSIPHDLTQADEESIKVKNWKNIKWGDPSPPALNGETLGRKSLWDRTDEISRSFAVSPDKQHFVIGSEWRLRYYDKNNVKQPIWDMQIPSEALAVNIAGNNKLAIVAYGDGTIRWHNLVDGKELLALFTHSSDRRWIAWTPQGYFMSSIGGEDLIGWQVSEGYNLPTSFYHAFRFRNDYYRPDIVRLVLTKLNINEAIKKANSDSGRKSPKTYIADIRPPSVEILTPKSGSSFTQEDVEITYIVHSPSDVEVTNLLVMVDGNPINDGDNRFSSKNVDKTLTKRVSLLKKDSNITLIPYYGNTPGVESTTSLVWEGKGESSPIKPKLFGLVMGMSGYKKNVLKFGAKDANDLKSSLETQNESIKSIYRETPDIRILTDEKKLINKSKILEALRTLAADVDFQKNTVTIVSYSGHGFVGRGGRFYLMPSDPPENAYPEDSSVSQEDLFTELRYIRGRKILFLDACRSGDGVTSLKRNVTSIMNAIKYEPSLGVYAFASSDSGELSFECDNVGRKNGCFTAAILDAIRTGNAADIVSAPNYTDTEELRRYLSSETLKLSQNRQNPVMIKSNPSMDNFQVFGHK